MAYVMKVQRVHFTNGVEVHAIYQDKNSIGTFEYVDFGRFLSALSASCDAAEGSHPAAPLVQRGYGVRYVEIVQDPDLPVRLVETARGIQGRYVKGGDSIG